MLAVISNLFRRFLGLFLWLGRFRDPVQPPVVVHDPSKLEINIRSPGGKSMVTTVDKRSSVADVKKRLGPQLCPASSDVESMRVIFAGKELSDEVTIEDCDLGPKSTIHVVFARQGVKNVSSVAAASSPLPELLATSLAEPPDGPEDAEPAEDLVEQTNDPEESKDNVESTEIGEAAQVENSYVPKKKVVSFYVLCSWKACPGKLRVRCDRCKEGAVMVLRDPESWDDVLDRRRVPASCETSACLNSSTFAEFYFKCAEHGSSDLPPLPLVRQNARNVPCLACTGVDNPVFVFPCSAGHVVCLECFVTYCNSWLNERRFVVKEDGYSIGCPAGCSDAWVNRSTYFKLLGKEQYERYQTFAAEDYVLSSGGALCPQPGCGMGILPPVDSCPGDQRRITCDREGGCGFVFCRECRAGYHLGPCDGPVGSPFPEGGGGDGQNCPLAGFSTPGALAERANLSSWSGGHVVGPGGDASFRTVRMMSKPCPSCRVSTERDGGCMHMTCRCGFNWCWVCQTEWTRDCMASHWFV